MRSLNLKNIICAVLALLSVLMLFTNCIVTAGETKFDWSKRRDALVNSLEDLQDDARWMGVNLDMSGPVKIVQALSNGKLTGSELKMVGAQLSKLIDIILPYSRYTGINIETFNTIQSLATFYSAIFILALVLGIFAAVTRFCGKWTFTDFPFFAVQIMIFCTFVGIVIKAKEIDFDLRLTLGAVLMLIFSIPRVLVGDFLSFILVGNKVTGYTGASHIRRHRRNIFRFKGINLKKIISAETIKRDGFCRNCGCSVRSGDRYCEQCGTRL